MRLKFASASASTDEGTVELPAGTGTDTSGRIARRIVIGIWAVILVLLLRHREVISSDTLSNYVHVWFVAQQLWHGNGLPFHMPVLAHGNALAFPYAFIPWMVAVLLWPVMLSSSGLGLVGCAWSPCRRRRAG